MRPLRLIANARRWPIAALLLAIVFGALLAGLDGLHAVPVAVRKGPAVLRRRTADCFGNAQPKKLKLQSNTQHNVGE